MCKAPSPLVTEGCQKPGTDLQDWRETGCHTNVFLLITVGPMPPDGYLEHIQKSLREWYREQCVSAGATSAADGAVKSQLEIVEIFMCTSCKKHQNVNYATVVLDKMVRC